MESKKQKLLIEYLISDTATFTLCTSIVKSEYFDPEYHRTIEFIQSYYSEYNKTPSPTQIEAETDIVLELHDVTPDQIKYTSTEIEKFCKQRAMESAILSSVEHIAEKDFGKVQELIKEAMLVSITDNLGLDYFDTVEERLERMLNTPNLISTGWKRVDDLLFGGIGRKEMILFAANSGGGKSVTLGNLASNILEQELNVVYVSLELSEDVVAQRFDAMYTGVTRKVWREETETIISELERVKEGLGNLTIVQMESGTTAAMLDGYLQEYYLKNNFYPDLFVLDYLDKMEPNQLIKDNVFAKDKAVSEQLRDLGVRYNMAIATASQLNRGAINDSDHNHSHIAGGISKINETDVFITLLKDEAMEAAGEIIFNFLKTRNSDGVGNSAHMVWDAVTLRITDDPSYSKRSSDAPIKENYKKKTKPTPKKSKQKDTIEIVSSGLGDNLDEIMDLIDSI